MKLTKDIRANIARKALEHVPSIDYHALLIPIVQNVLRDHMPPEVRAVYDNKETREYLPRVHASIREGNGYNGTSMWIQDPPGLSHYRASHGFYGLQEKSCSLEIRVTPEVVERLKKGTLIYDLTQAVIKSGYFAAHMAQEQLLASVKKRLNDTLASVTTVKRLYDVLEPELHHLIPKEGDKKINLPATAAPVVDDLRKLGAVLPEVPKTK